LVLSTAMSRGKVCPEASVVVVPPVSGALITVVLRALLVQ
jgi:hypothetical protein